MKKTESTIIIKQQWFDLINSGLFRREKENGIIAIKIELYNLSRLRKMKIK